MDESKGDNVGPVQRGSGEKMDAQHLVPTSKSQGVSLVQSAAAKISQWTSAVTGSPLTGVQVCRELSFSLTKL